MIEGGASSPAVGLVGGAAEIGLEVRPAPLGDVVEILLRNTTARPVEAGLSLLW